MSKNFIPAKDVTQKQIDDWKKQYGSVSRFRVKEEDGTEKVCYVRNPTVKEIDYASANLTKGAFQQYGITLFNTCQIGGDEITDEYALMAAGQQMNSLIEAVQVEVEKL